MTREDKINALKVRIKKLEGRGDKNLKAPGVLRKLNRELRNLKTI